MEHALKRFDLKDAAKFQRLRLSICLAIEAGVRKSSPSA